MTWIHPFDAAEIPGDDKTLLGGKGASLRAMTLAGLHVPPGFTITTEACAHFYEHHGKWPEGLERELREHIHALEIAMGAKLGAGEPPLLVSVRSGASASMPGMMDTLLNCGLTLALGDQQANPTRYWPVYARFIQSFAKTVAGLPEAGFEFPAAAGRDDVTRLLRHFDAQSDSPFPQEPWDLLLACINAVFRSWNSERAIAYRARNHISGLLGTAVNVQAMFPSRVSGIVFTQDPNQLAAEQMVIESSHGLGESVVSGEVTPDRFLVNRHDFKDVRSFAGEKKGMIAAFGESDAADEAALTLSPGQLEELCALSLKVEEYFGLPMDIEFGWANGRFALLQSRPIRGLDLVRDALAACDQEKARLRHLADGRRRLWVAHNLGETLRTPTPLTWDIIRGFMGGDGGFGLMYRDFGYQPSKKVREEGFLELILGRIYADPERVAQMFWDGLPMAYDLPAILKNKSELDRPPTRFMADQVDETFLVKLPGAVRSMFRASRAMKKLRPRAKSDYETKVLPPYLQYIREKRGEDLAALATPDLLRELDGRRNRVLNDFGKESLKPPFFAGMALGQLEAMLCQLMGTEEGTRIGSLLTMGLDHDSTYEQDLLLSKVARGEATLEDFLDIHGHRATNEMELGEPRWREDPSFLLTVIGQMRSGMVRSLEDRHHDNIGKAQAALAALPQQLADAGGSSLREEIGNHLRQARELLPYRETGKFHLMMGYELIRNVLTELGRRWDLDRDVMFLHLDELPQWERDHARLRPLLESRKLRWKSVQRLYVPDVVDSEQLDTLGHVPVYGESDEIKGEPISAGVSTGVARIIFNPREAGDPGEDYILVCPSTDPGWTPLFVKAKGLIVERGGILSHGAIVARDFGIPALVCPMATRLLTDGELLHLDGNHGRILRRKGKA